MFKTTTSCLINPQVFAAAMFFAVVIKDPNKAEEESDQEGNELNPDEEALHDKTKNSEEEKALRKVGFFDKPPNPEKLQAARQLKLKQKEMKTIIREVLQYIFFLGVLLVVAYGSRDPIAFRVTSAMRTVFEDGKYTGLDSFDEVFYCFLLRSRNLIRIAFCCCVFSRQNLKKVALLNWCAMIHVAGIVL